MRQHGFTMLELLVTIIVMSVLAVMAAPTLIELTSRQELERSTTDLIGKIQQAQYKASKENKVIELKFNVTTSDSTHVSWFPFGKTAMVSSGTSVFFNPSGYIQKSATDSDYAGYRKLLLCDDAKVSAVVSRIVSVNRAGIVTDSGTLGGCSE